MKIRSSEKEKLDDLNLDGETLHQALKSLGWINKWFGNHSAVKKAIHRIYIKEQRPLRIVDLGCGGGDLALALARSMRRHKISCRITGIDGNAHALVYAQKKCRGYNEIDFLPEDILDKAFSIQPCDILISSHFMYHFTADAMVEFLKNNLSSVSTAFIFSELKRNPFAMRLFKFSSFLLPISKLAKEDGVLAIKRAYTEKEWITIMQRAGIGAYRIEHAPFFRILITIYKIRKM